VSKASRQYDAVKQKKVEISMKESIHARGTCDALCIIDSLLYRAGRKAKVMVIVCVFSYTCPYKYAETLALRRWRADDAMNYSRGGG
jgi:hypothetical protein